LDSLGGILSRNLDFSHTPSRKRATILQAVGGYALTGVNIVQGLVLIPLYLHYIGVHIYGLWLASGGVLGMLGLMNFGISNILIQRIASFYGKKDFPQVGIYFINGMIVYIGICLLLGLVGWIISLWLPDVLTAIGNDSDLFQQCFQVAVVAMVLAVFNECLRSFSQALLRPIIPIMGMVVGRIVGIGVTIWMLFDGFGLWAIPVGSLVAESLILLLNVFNALGLFRRLSVRVEFKKSVIKEYCKTAPVLLMATAGNKLSQEAEPLLITVFLSPEVTTAYMITRRAADIVFRMLNVIIGSTMGSFSHLAGVGDHEKIKSVAKKLLTLSFSMGVIGFATYVGANQAFVSLWVGASFILDQNIVLFIALGFFARTFRVLIGQMLYSLGDFTYTSTIVLFEGVARIGLAIALLSILGIIGVPLAFIISCAITILVLGIRLKNKLEIRLRFNKLARLFVSGMIIIAITFLLEKMIITAIDSWVIFSVYLTMLLLCSSMLYLILNAMGIGVIYKEAAVWKK
jgi:O-antigen/teichoic acid export membrane protein